jgi:SAM-dependent methyltransferase
MSDGGYEPVFNRNYALAYELFSSMLARVVECLPKPQRVLDIGCGDGWTAAFLASRCGGMYLGIDPSAESIKALTGRFQGEGGLQVIGLQRSAEWLLTAPAGSLLVDLLDGLPSLIICNAVIHQLRKSQWDIGEVIIRCAEMLQPRGCLLLGDYYYLASLSEEEVQNAQEWIRKITGQNPTARDLFCSRDEMLQVFRQTSLEISEVRETRANAGTPLLYYLFIARRGE